MKKNLTACLITFALKEFPIHTSKTLSFSGKELCSGISQMFCSWLILLILIYAGWDSHALYCQLRSYIFNLMEDHSRKSALNELLLCVFHKLKVLGTHTQCLQQEELFRILVFSFCQQSWLCKSSDGYSQNRFLWRDLILSSQSVLLIMLLNTSLVKETYVASKTFRTGSMRGWHAD